MDGINPHICAQLIYNKEPKSIQWGKDNLSIKRYSDHRLSILNPTQKSTQNELKSWNHEIPRTKHGRQLHDIHLGSGILDWYQNNKSKNKQVGLHQIKTFHNSIEFYNSMFDGFFCTAKETITWKSNLCNGRKYLQIRYLIRS